MGKSWKDGRNSKWERFDKKKHKTNKSVKKFKNNKKSIDSENFEDQWN